MVFSYMIRCGLSVVAIAATEPMAYVHIMPEMSMYSEHSTRSAVLFAVNSP